MLNTPEIMISTRDFDRLIGLVARAYDSVDIAPRLYDELSRATLLAPWRMPSNVAMMGSVVRYLQDGNCSPLEARLVYPEDIDGSGNKISILSSVGAALLGLSAGDSIAWPIQRQQNRVIRLIEVLYQPNYFN